MSEWISVKDRLPNDDEKYLTCSDKYRWVGIDNFLPDFKAFTHDYVTHWMPIPLPPKEPEE